MKHDLKPSLILGGALHPDKWKAFEEEHKKRGYKLREIKLYEVTINTEKDKYDEQINFYKTFMRKRIWSMFNSMFKSFFGKIFKKKISKSLGGFEFVNPEWNWSTNKRNNFLSGYVSPIFVDQKYSDNEEIQGKYFEGGEEIENYKKLKSFESKGYMNDQQKDIQAIIKWVDTLATKDLKLKEEQKTNGKFQRRSQKL